MSNHLVCKSCDLTVNVDHNKTKDMFFCPRCGRKLKSSSITKRSDIATVAFSAIIFLCISIVEPFMSISAMGVGSSMSLYSIISILQKQWGMLLYSFLFFTFFAPLDVLVTIVFVCGFKLKPSVFVGKIFSFNHKMCMVDVFVLGILVSLIKLTSLANVDFYIGFYTTFIFSLMLVWVCHKFRPEELWEIIYPQESVDVKAGINAEDQNLKCCDKCGYYFHSENDVDKCPRCGSNVYFRNNSCLSKSFCLLLSALILYVPSNLYPVMYTEFMKSSTGSNIIDGIIAMWNMKSYFVSMVILLASIFIPAFKIISLCFIIYVTKIKKIRNISKVSKLYRIVLIIGRWSLIDVYVVIIMSAIVKIGGLLSIYPGFAIVCFCSVVIITLFSAEEFDERLIWDIKK